VVRLFSVQQVVTHHWVSLSWYRQLLVVIQCQYQSCNSVDSELSISCTVLVVGAFVVSVPIVVVFTIHSDSLVVGLTQ